MTQYYYFKDNDGNEHKAQFSYTVNLHMRIDDGAEEFDDYELCVNEIYLADFDRKGNINDTSDEFIEWLNEYYVEAETEEFSTDFEFYLKGLVKRYL